MFSTALWSNVTDDEIDLEGLSNLLKTTQLKYGKVRIQTRSDSQTMPHV